MKEKGKMTEPTRSRAVRNRASLKAHGITRWASGPVRLDCRSGVICGNTNEGRGRPKGTLGGSGGRGRKYAGQT